MKSSTRVGVSRINRQFRSMIDSLPTRPFAALMIIVAFGITGSVLLAGSKATTPTASKEAESGTVGTVATTVADSTASAAQAVKFGSGSTGGTGTTCTVGQAPGSGNCIASPAPTLSGKQWKVIFNDDFNGSSLDTSKWTPCFDWNYGDCTATFNNGREYYQPSQDQLSGGIAHLKAEPMSPPISNGACYTGSCTYKAGLISTARPNAGNGSGYLFPFTYGYVEAKMKYPAVSGMFTAFWMLPTDPTYTYASSEIDIVEILGGDPNTIFMTYSWGTNGGNRNSSFPVNNGDHNNGACAVKDYSQDWVRFGVDWEPASIAWYIDGVKCGQITSTTAFIENTPMQLILNNMVDNNWERSWNLTLPNLSTAAETDVDYVHIYQQQ